MSTAWLERSLGEIATRIGSGATPRGGSKVYLPDGIPLIRSQNVRAGHLDLSDVAFISSEQHARMRRSQVRPGDILLNITGASIGRSCVVPGEVPTANVNQHVCIIRVKDGAVPGYVQAMLDLPRIQQRIFDVAAGGSRDGLNFEQVAALSIPWVPQNKQVRIDRAVTLIKSTTKCIEVLIAAKCDLRRAIMQDLLTGKRRFPEFMRSNGHNNVPPEDWSILELHNVTDIRVSNVDKHSRENEVPVSLCNYMDVWTKMYIRSGAEFMESTATPAQIARFGLQPGDVLLTKDSETREEIAQPSVVLPDAPELVLGYHLAMLRPDPERVDGRFLAAQLRIPRFRNHFVAAAQGATRFGLTIETLRSAEVWFPRVAEQKRIADFDFQLHLEIEKLETLLEHLQVQRRGLMQKLLSDELEISKNSNETTNLGKNRDALIPVCAPVNLQSLPRDDYAHD